MMDFNPLAPEVSAELVAMSNRLIEIENALTRIMQQPIAHRLMLAREALFMAIDEINGEARRWDTPF